MQGAEGKQQCDDADALRRIARGDLTRFDAFVGRYRARVTSYVFHRVGDLHRAEDIAQEAFLRAFRAAADGGFRGNGSAAPWLFAIARNCATDYLRGREAPAVPLPVEGLAADGQRRAADEDDPASDLLAALPEPQRDVVALKVLCGLTFSEIAEVMGCPAETAKSRMRYGLRKLREALSQQRRGDQ